jgi:Zn-dependent peptidase ImmA (M78 family)/DNA-binding XRE family transcriptional regulator
MSPYDFDPAVLGERLRIARSSANLTQDHVATQLSMARTTLVAIERGQRRVKPDEMTALSQLYGVSVGRLVAPDTIHVDMSAKFRRVGDKNESNSVASAISLLNSLAVGAVELERSLGMELRTDYPPPLRIMPNAYAEQAEDAAISIRQRLGVGLGKIGDLFSSLELDLGVRVFCRSLGSGNISGLYAFDPAVGACILVNANHPRRRRVLTLAHECGHFVSDRSHADVLDDAPVPASLEERFARRFSSAFLMPSPIVRTRFNQIVGREGNIDIRGLVLMAHQFDVTTEAMSRRLEELDLLADGTWDSILHRGFNSKMEREVLGDPEPTMPPLLIPPRLAYLAALALKEEALSEGQLCELLVVDRVQLRDSLAAFGDGSDGISYA